MLISVIVTLCLAAAPETCIERTVTDEATMMQCSGAMAAQVLPAWMAENGYTARGYRLAKWGCVPGGFRKVRA
ncbi:hypothetical protein ACQR1I_36690 [Bradyrhizobium sp. HKCCYLS2038]|uniref:hypothetical protein n=1 Tax=Bradyrhizobium sp. HKCCYLS2038 TaxID=3420764 RepID=UPI003EB7D528